MKTVKKLEHWTSQDLRAPNEEHLNLYVLIDKSGAIKYNVEDWILDPVFPQPKRLHNSQLAEDDYRESIDRMNNRRGIRTFKAK